MGSWEAPTTSSPIKLSVSKVRGDEEKLVLIVQMFAGDISKLVYELSDRTDITWCSRVLVPQLLEKVIVVPGRCYGRIGEGNYSGNGHRHSRHCPNNYKKVVCKPVWHGWHSRNSSSHTDCKSRFMIQLEASVDLSSLVVVFPEQMLRECIYRPVATYVGLLP